MTLSLLTKTTTVATSPSGRSTPMKYTRMSPDAPTKTQSRCSMRPPRGWYTNTPCSAATLTTRLQTCLKWGTTCSISSNSQTAELLLLKMGSFFYSHKTMTTQIKKFQMKMKMKIKNKLSIKKCHFLKYKKLKSNLLQK